MCPRKKKQSGQGIVQEMAGMRREGASMQGNKFESMMRWRGRGGCGYVGWSRADHERREMAFIIYIYIHTYIHTYIHIHIYTYIHINYICVCVCVFPIEKTFYGEYIL